MNQEIKKTECGFVVIDTLENLNPDLTDKVEHNTNGMIQLLEIEGVELRFDQKVSENGGNVNLTSVCTKWFEKDSLTNEDLEQLQEAHGRIIETISTWSWKKRSKIKSLDPKPQKEPTPYEILREFAEDESRIEMTADELKEFNNAIAKALGYMPSQLLLCDLTQSMIINYVRSKENQKKL